MEGKGLPIGNLTSQLLTNVYLAPADHFLKDEKGLRYDVRYMDDIRASKKAENRQNSLPNFWHQKRNVTLCISATCPMLGGSQTKESSRGVLDTLGRHGFPLGFEG